MKRLIQGVLMLFRKEKPRHPYETQPDLPSRYVEELEKGGLSGLVRYRAMQAAEAAEWCTCGAKTPQGQYHKPGCPAREKLKR
jgi:hypothetical protein